MSFNVALSGIAAAQTDLNSTAHNIANVNTVGFKESRAEFNSIFSQSTSENKTGNGVETSTVAQQFHQGSLKFSENPLDLAITGQGFFVTTSNEIDRDFKFTRAGMFKLNDNNDIVSNQGDFLQAFPVNQDGSSSSISLSTTEKVHIPETAGVPIRTSKIDIALNLPAGSTPHDPAKFDPDDSSTYNHATSVAVYDSLGESHITSTYYLKPFSASYTGNNHWVTFVTVDENPVSVWDVTQGRSIAGSYGKDLNNDGVEDTLDNLNADVNKLTILSNAAIAAHGITKGFSDASEAAAVAAEIANTTAIAANTQTPTAANAALVVSTGTAAIAARQQATIDAVATAIDKDKETAAIKAKNDASAIVLLATDIGVTGEASYITKDGNEITGGVLTFDAVGVYKGSSPELLTLQSLGIDDPSSVTEVNDGANILDPGADGNQRLILNYQAPTQFSSNFEVTNLEQDGLTVGRLTGVDIDKDGLVKATYSNGTSQPLARVALVRFHNNQGLSQSGSSWVASESSGVAIAGEAAAGSYGTINSASLEQSNVNLTTELFDLITAQRNFQANSRVLEVNNTLQQTILQIR